MREEGDVRRLGRGVLQDQVCYGSCNLSSWHKEVAMQGVRRLCFL